MDHVIGWARVSILRNNNNWLPFAYKLLPFGEVIAIKSDHSGGGANQCLMEVLNKWWSKSREHSWAMIVEALGKLPYTEEILENISANFKA